ncbi:hypothetical protein [Streptomyces sp. NBC_00140]|uniref:hypothetical protein n=1 Tax=Streptomyces sp. NBC_00140 TaxID=2975664 RepID=UPI00225A3056|nr:hypothetical protein [Streptomyces sp. NBC_00140]MCX5335495.1 hypothetical protein [Streptomyces sp. NBC_00140]MCX5338325.1 hypothetical protein [Streptomyces sp. NBC_00140]
MATIDFPDDLIELERSAWAEIQRGELTVDTARAVHDAIAAYVARDDVDATRLDVEMQLKRIVRHPETADAG